MRYTHIYHVPMRLPRHRRHSASHDVIVSVVAEWLRGVAAFRNPGSVFVRVILEIHPENQYWNMGVPLSPKMITEHGWTNYTHVYNRWVLPEGMRITAWPHALGKFAKRKRVTA